MWRIPLYTKRLAGAHFRGTDADLEDLNALALEIASLFHRLAMLTRTTLPAGAPPDTVARFANINLERCCATETAARHAAATFVGALRAAADAAPPPALPRPAALTEVRQAAPAATLPTAILLLSACHNCFEGMGAYDHGGGNVALERLEASIYGRSTRRLAMEGMHVVSKLLAGPFDRGAPSPRPRRSSTPRRPRPRLGWHTAPRAPSKSGSGPSSSRRRTSSSHCCSSSSRRSRARSATLRTRARSSRPRWRWPLLPWLRGPWWSWRRRRL